MSAFRFDLRSRSGRARRGTLRTTHGIVDTPAFMPVGTRAAVKGLTTDQIAATGTQIVLGNTYHLLLRPGPETIATLGGLQKFTGWRRPMLTDSGGFQVFSLADLNHISDDGVEFRSHIDGALLRLTPETSIAAQHALGADIIMAFDDCPALPATEQRLADSVARTLQWAARCITAHADSTQALYGIIQGGLDLNLRRRCRDALADLPFHGYAIGGLSVGEPPPEMWSLLDAFADSLPDLHPRYLMGVGTPRDLVEAVDAGVDQFDCVLPTRNGRKGYAYTSTGIVRLRNAAHIRSAAPLDEACSCPCCTNHTRGYLRHLIKSEEVLGATLISLHNLQFYQDLMARIRAAIEEDRWAAFRDDFRRGPHAAPREENA